jgi:hypothetical protein
MKHIALLLFIFISFVSCQEVMKSSYISEFETFITDLEKKSGEYKAEDWAKADIVYKKLAEEDFKKYEAQLTAEERGKVNNLKGIYYSIYAKSKIKDIGTDFKDAMQQLEGGLKQLEKDLKDLEKK